MAGRQNSSRTGRLVADDCAVAGVFCARHECLEAVHSAAAGTFTISMGDFQTALPSGWRGIGQGRLVFEVGLFDISFDTSAFPFFPSTAHSLHLAFWRPAFHARIEKHRDGQLDGDLHSG